MSLTAAASGFVVFLLSAQVIQANNGWGVKYTSTQICAVRGSTVEISCSYTYPKKSYSTSADNTFWFTTIKNDQPQDLKEDRKYSGRVFTHCSNNICTLKIKSLKDSDSAEYKFRFKTSFPAEAYTGLPGVTLFVREPDLQVQVSRSYSTWLLLKCHSRCVLPDHPSYTWFKNEVTIWQGSSQYYSVNSGSEDSYSCAIRKYTSYSPPVYTPRRPSVSVSPSAEIEEGSSVTLNCSSDANPAANYTWYRKTVNPHLEPLSKKPQLVFSSIQSSDSGQYYCTAKNELGSKTTITVVDVKYAPKRPSVSVSPSAEIVEGSSVTLSCSSDANPAAKYTWYKENQTLPSGKEAIFNFTSVSSEDRGKYYCTSENQYGQINSASLLINVQYAPKRPSVSVNPSTEVMWGSSVTLSCSSDANPAANYTWYKENQTLVQGPDGIHHVTSIRSEDSGIYHCKSENKYGNFTSSTVHIDVQYAPKRLSVSVSPSAEIEEGSSVTLTCSSDANPAAKYTWYKEDEESPKAFRQIFIITEIRAEHSGNYYCEARNSRGRQNSTLHLIIVSSSMKSVAAGSITVIFLALIFLSAFLLLRRKKSLEQTLEPRVRPDNKLQVNMVTVRDVPSAPRPRSQAEQQDDLCYASVTFLKNREDPLYSNIRLGQPIRPKEVEEEDDEEDEEEDVEYTAVMFKSNGAATGSTHQEAAEDSSELYSTVCKNTRV